MKRRSVSYTPAAGDDLDWIYDTIAEVTSPVVASGYEQRIREACQRLELGAERGTLHDDLRPGLRTIGFDRRVTIAFAVEENRVVILRIFLEVGIGLGTSDDHRCIASAMTVQMRFPLPRVML